MRSFEKFVAFRYLRSKRKEVFISIITVISVLGVGLSVMVLDIVLSVMTGFETELQEKLVDANAHVTIRSFGGNIEHYEDIVARVEQVPGVTGVYPYTYNQAMITTKLGSRGLLIRGVADMEIPREKLQKTLDDPGNIDRLFGKAEVVVLRPDGIEDVVKLPAIIVGDALATSMHLMRGNPVTLFSPDLTASPQGLVPKLRRFVPVGKYKTGLIEYENGMAYMSLEESQKFFAMGARVTGVEVSVNDLFAAPKIGVDIAGALSSLDAGLYVKDWTDINKPLWDAIRLEKKVYFIVLLLLILIASFSIVSTLVMVVMEKSKDIAVLKSLGASDSAVKKIFLVQGAVIGACGVILGTVLGYLGCITLRKYGFPIDEVVFGLSTVPVHMEPANFLLVAAAGFIITAAAGLYPASRAAKLRPADALRYE